MFCIKFCKYVVFLSRKAVFLANYENIRLIRTMLRIFFSCLTEIKTNYFFLDAGPALKGGYIPLFRWSNISNANADT